MTVLQTGPYSRTGTGGQVEAMRLHFLWGSWVGTEARGLQGREGLAFSPSRWVGRGSLQQEPRREGGPGVGASVGRTVEVQAWAVLRTLGIG